MGVAKLLFGLRTCQPPLVENVVSCFDKGLREAIEDIVVCGGGAFFGDLQWRVATLPLRLGGLGLSSARDVATYAFVASRSESWGLQDHILRNSGVAHVDTDYSGERTQENIHIHHIVLGFNLLVMERTFLVDGRTIAMAIKTTGLQCSSRVDNSDASDEWPGFPIGMKFDPSDVQLLEHLAAKCGVGDEKPHVYIDVFIPTIDVDEGICYTHPENLPGARKDGNSFHLFYKTKNADASGQRKRRQIYHGTSSANNVCRWHKTGKTTHIINKEAPLLSGHKKIFVLYETITGVSRRRKLDWVMHEYHLGSVECEKEGELVVSKIFHKLTSLETLIQAEAPTDDNVNLNDAAEAADSTAIYPTFETTDLAELDLVNDGSFSELLHMLENGPL
ncbi:No apical meristem (NAM) protein [Artemisia annua]|uniref:No apical meristem (NAM) protein n=1 Tax=Artemisia annua TaxID=35608 RepID=A0A2U1QGP8_ARTAN|nr:No apical meristem (NAM) protein [Artemisia annua]